VTFDLFRRHGLTTIFGNPGSNELTFLDGMPADFRYILGLHEGVVTAMADGYAQASGAAVLVNLHAAAGSGNAMGALTNAQNSHSPLVITAGQQNRKHIGVRALLTNVEASQLPRPLVKWSSEPATPDDVPRTMAEAIHIAYSHPRGPVYVSVPYDDWATEASESSEHLAARTVSAARTPSVAQVRDIVARFESATNPVLVLGPDVDASGANDLSVRLAEKLSMPVWIAPSASRCPFPTTHPHFRGVLPASISGISRTLAGHDLIVVVGAPVFRYHQFEPGALLPPGANLVQITVDPDEAARAPMGDAIVAGIVETLEAIVELLIQSERPAPTSRQLPPAILAGDAPLAPATVFDVIYSVAPSDAIYVKESTSTTAIFWDHIHLANPGSYFFPAAGGLGFGLPAAVGVQLAVPERRVIAIIGDGSANYALSALWTAAQHDVPITVIVMKNGTYAALQAFADAMNINSAPGIDIPDMSFVALANGYGVRAESVTNAQGLQRALTAAFGQNLPTVIEVPTQVVNPFD